MGIVSLVVDLTSGDMIEAAMIGQDGSWEAPRRSTAIFP